MRLSFTQCAATRLVVTAHKLEVESSLDERFLVMEGLAKFSWATDCPPTVR